MLTWLGSLPAQQRAPTFFTVVDDAGKPLAGATVTCVHSPDLISPWPSDVVTAISDERGRARCELIVGRLHTAWAVGASDAAGNRFLGEPMTLVAAGRVLTMATIGSRPPRRVSVRGHEAWREVGARTLRWYPVAEADAYMDLAWPEGEQLALPPSPWALGCLCLVDGNGEILAATGVEPDSSTPAPFVAPFAVSATVQGGDGKPLAGATLTQLVARGSNAPPLFGGYGGTRSTRTLGSTDATGQLRCHVSWEPPARPELPQRSRQFVHASAPGHEHTVQPIAATGTLTIRMAGKAETVVDVLGGPSEFRLFAIGSSTSKLETRGVSFLPHGLSVQARSPTRWTVEACYFGCQPRLAIVDKIPTAVVTAFVGADAAETTIDLRQAMTVDVRVRDAEGGPVACAVAVSRVSDGSVVTWDATLASDLAGQARLLLARDEYLVYATTGPAHALAMLTKEHRGSVELRLEPLPRMRFRVRDAEGQPVAGVRLRAASASFRSTGGTSLEAQWDRLAGGMWSACAARTITGVDGRMQVPVFARPGLTAKVVATRGTRRSQAVSLVPGGDAEVVLDQ